MSNQNPNNRPLISSSTHPPLSKGAIVHWMNTCASKFRFTIGSMLILTTVFAAFSVCLSYYARALWVTGSLEWMGWQTPPPSKTKGTEIGMFAIVAAMVPTVFLVVASWFLKAASFVAKLFR